MKDIILMGMAGSGKGTQSKLLRERFGENVKYFEMGAILRALQSNDNALGNYMANYVPKGLIINPAIPAGLRGVFMETLAEGDIILGDGVLRTLEQTVQIFQKMRDKKREFLVFLLEISDEEVYVRLANRVSKDGVASRNDDTNLEAIKKRIELFHRDTEPALRWIEEQGALVRLNGMQSEEEIF
jgi:adenylate kinase